MDQNPRHQDETSALLRSLRGATPPDEVQRRLIERSLEAVERNQRTWVRTLGMAIAGATAAVALGVGLHLYAPVPSAPSGPYVPASGSLHTSKDLPSSFQVGPHDVRLSPASIVKVAAAERDLTELLMEAGTATFDVKPLGPEETFRVRTEQVLVEVVGTRFSVQAQQACSVVIVEEGQVRVTDHQGVVQLLNPNDRGRYCAAGASDALLREALVLISQGEALDEAAQLLRSYLDQNPGSALEEEAHYHLCLVYGRLGAWEEARRLATSFQERFPTSPRVARLTQWLEEQP